MPRQWSSTWIQSRSLSPSPYSGTGWSSIRFVVNSGMTFSGNWYGPKLFVQRVTVTGSPYVEKYERAMRSEPALDAE